MAVLANWWRTNLPQLIALAGAGVAVVALLTRLEFFVRPGTADVLRGLAQHAFVLGWLLLLTARSRTVSLATLGIFWLLGVWAVYGVAYLIEEPLANLWGAEDSDTLVPVWLAPLTEEALKLLPVAIFLVVASRGGRQIAATDGLLLGFMVGAGVSFTEDAHIGSIQLSGEGWGAAMPWTMLFPTLTPVGDLLALNHALWAALSGLGVGVAVMFRHWRWVWPIALAGPLLALSNHVMLNHFAVNVFEAIGRADAPAPYSTIRDLTDGGRLPMVVLVVGVLAVVVAQWLILRWVSKRDRTFPPLPIGHALGLIAHATSRTGAAQVLAADRYLRLRRSVYFAAWRTRTAGGYPDVSDADYAELVSLAARLEILPPYQPSAPPAVASPDAPAEAPAT